MNRPPPRHRTRSSLPLLLLALLVPLAPALAQRQTREVTRLADGVYAVTYSEMRFDPVQSNSLIIIGDDGVCVVDAHYTPSAARETIAAIRRLTRLPVRYVVTTHWHDDHIFGNQEYRAAYPGVEFVAQQYTRESMIAKALEHQQQLVQYYTTAIPSIEAHLKSGLSREGTPLSAEDKAEWTRRLPIFRDFLADFRQVKIVLPTITFDKELTLHLGSREIQVRSFGPGNTRGDAVIYLPKEKIVAVGDLVVYPVPFIYGGFPRSWLQVLTAVRGLEPTIIVPGHGPVMRDFAYVDQVTTLLAALSQQVGDAVTHGLTLEETRKTVDLRAIREQMVQGDQSRDDTFASSILDSGVEAAYKEAKGGDGES